MAKLTKAQIAEREDTLNKMRKMLPPGSNVYVNITHVSRSGMSRHMRLYYVDEERDIIDITGYVARVLGYRRATENRWDLVVSGCGMDMAFHTVYQLGSCLYPDGDSLDKTNGIRRRQAEREGVTKEVSGGYLLNKRDI
jgi:hypothetical protein